MSRFQLVEYDDASPGVRAVYDDFLRETCSFELPYWIKSLGHSENLARAYWHRVHGTLVVGELPRILKELILFVVSVVDGAPYCAASHAHAALQFDKTLTYDDLVAMTKDLDAVARPPAHRAALRFADKAARDADLITDDDFAALSSAGFIDSEITEIISTIDMGLMFNNFTKMRRLPIDPQYRPILPETADQPARLAN